MTSFSGGIVDVLLNWIWQGCAVALAASLLVGRSRSLTPAIRYRLWWAALGLVAALPWMASSLAWRPAAESAAPDSGGSLVSLPHLPAVSIASGALAVIWIGIGCVRLAIAVAAVSRAKRAAGRFPDDRERQLHHWSALARHNRRARLVLSNRVRHAAVLGWRTPLIAVAPALLDELSDAELDQVVIHEWAHIERRDDIAALAQRVIGIAIGWHPAVWWINRHLDIEREAACDDRVVTVTGSGKSYAACLTKLAGMPRRPSVPLMAPAVMLRSRLGARVARLVQRPRPISAARRAIAASATLPALIAVAVLSGSSQVVATAATNPISRPPDIELSAKRGAPASVVAPRPGEPAPTAALPVRLVQRGPVAPAAIERPAALVSDSGPEILVIPVVGVGESTPPVDLPVAQLPIALSAPPPQPLIQEPPAPARRAEVGRSEPASPWSTAADAGVAVGRTSQKAAVATAGFFTRLSKRLAGSF